MQAHLNPVANTTAPSRRKRKLIPAVGMEENRTLVRFSEEEDEALRSLVEQGFSDAQIALELDRARVSIQARRKVLGIAAAHAANVPWAPEDVDTLKALHADGLTVDEIADALERSANSVRWMVVRSGLTPHKPRRKRKAADYDALRRLFADGIQPEVIAKKLDMSTASVKAVRHRLGYSIKKPGTVTRPCITCEGDFASEGPHNRMCPICLETNETTPWDSAYSVSMRRSA